MLRQKAAALRDALRMGGDPANVGSSGLGMHRQTMAHIDHLLGQDNRVGAEGEVVERRRDGAFQRILLADDAEAHRPIVDAIEDLVERSALHQIGVVDAETGGETQSRFVAVRSGRTQKSDGILVAHVKPICCASFAMSRANHCATNREPRRTSLAMLHARARRRVSSTIIIARRRPNGFETAPFRSLSRALRLLSLGRTRQHQQSVSGMLFRQSILQGTLSTISKRLSTLSSSRLLSFSPNSR